VFQLTFTDLDLARVRRPQLVLPLFAALRLVA
jgi:hypothetical protein